MEPSFIATPYVQANSPHSRQIRAWLDEREANYELWRASRKPVKHAFVSAKLNLPVRTAAKPRAALDVLASIPLWQTLSNQTATEAASPAIVTQKRPETSGERHVAPSLPNPSAALKAAVAVAVSADSVFSASSASRKSSLQRSSVSTPVLPNVVKDGTASQRHLDSAKLGRKSVQHAALPHLSAMAAAATTVATRVRTPARVRTSALAKKRLQEHLYDFHSRHVFSFAQNPEDETSPLDSTELLGCMRDAPLDYESNNNAPLSNADTPQIKSASADVDAVTAPAPVTDSQHASCILDGVVFMAPQDYTRMLEHDWHLSDVDRVVRDAVERQRIYAVLQSAYRELLWFFRFYAGKSALASGADYDVFQIPSKLHLLEDLNVPCVDPPRFGITDTPLRRDAFIGFLLSVAKMISSHSANPARLRVLVTEGIELSDAMQTLVRDHFRVYAQIQDANHFRFVFLHKSRAGAPTMLARARYVRRVESVLSKHRVNLENFFRESVSRTPVTGDSNHSTARQSMTVAQFLAALRALGLIANPNAAAVTSSSTVSGSGSTVASAPSAVEEGRALHVFLACLSIRDPDYTVRNAGVSIREATLEQFIEALLRVALMRRELMVCRGGYDVCPGELTSELCVCTPESAQYDFAAFDDAVEELFAAIHALRLKQAHKHAPVKMRSLRSLQVVAMQPSLLRTQQHLSVTMTLVSSSDDEDERGSE